MTEFLFMGTIPLNYIAYITELRQQPCPVDIDITIKKLKIFITILSIINNKAIIVIILQYIPISSFPPVTSFCIKSTHLRCTVIL